LDEIAGRGRSAIVVGGTGLYFRALTAGLAEIPPVPATVRAEVQATYDRLGEAALRDELARIDPASAARIAAGDRQRLTRAMEVFTATGQPLGDWQASTSPALAPGSWSGLVLEPRREALYARCDARLAAMVAGGALEEVQRLVARRLGPALPGMKALGVAPLAAHLRGEISLDAALDQARQDTRRYAKRQLTWFRHRAPDWPRVSGPGDAA
jgi:tRNA dimethylallyltransferase